MFPVTDRAILNNRTHWERRCAMPSTNEVVGTIHYNFDPLYVIITITAGLTYKATLNARKVIEFVRGVILDTAIHQHSRGESRSSVLPCKGTAMRLACNE